MKKLSASIFLALAAALVAVPADAVTTVDVSHPQTTDNYTTLLSALVTENQALGSFGRSDLYTYASQPTGMMRLNASTGLIESWSGSAWSAYPLSYLQTTSSGTQTVSGTVNFTGTLQAGAAAVATQNYVTSALASYAPLASPSFTGTPAISGVAIATQTFVSASYAPLTGAGVSGTWGISITGNAATATTATSATSATSASTSTTQAAGTSNTSIATTAFANPSGTTLAVAGATKLPSGLMFKWGNSVINNPTTITYPSAFPNATLNVQLTNNSNTGGFSAVYAVSSSGFSAINSAAGVTVYWFATGY